jgi:hypothetical protein
MTTNKLSALEIAISQFLAGCGQNYDFPAGGSISIPSETEKSLVNALQRMSNPQPKEIAQFRRQLGFRESYKLLIFAVRMGILAARRGDASLLQAGLIGLVLDKGHVDYRDLLGALAIIEECSLRVHLDLHEELRSVAPLIEDARLRDTIDGYFAREPQMRQTEVLGFKIVDSKEGLAVIENR